MSGLNRNIMALLTSMALRGVRQISTGGSAGKAFAKCATHGPVCSAALKRAALKRRNIAKHNRSASQ